MGRWPISSSLQAPFVRKGSEQLSDRSPCRERQGVALTHSLSCALLIVSINRWKKKTTIKGELAGEQRGSSRVPWTFTKVESPVIASSTAPILKCPLCAHHWVKPFNYNNHLSFIHVFPLLTSPRNLDFYPYFPAEKMEADEIKKVMKSETAGISLFLTSKPRL